MSEKQKKTMDRVSDAINALPEEKQEHLLLFMEGFAAGAKPSAPAAAQDAEEAETEGGGAGA